MQGTMTSIYNIGCFVGAMSTIWTGDIFGRPRQIMLGSTVIAVGAVIQTSSYGVAQMMVGRIVAGLGTKLACYACVEVPVAKRKQELA